MSKDEKVSENLEAVERAIGSMMPANRRQGVVAQLAQVEEPAKEQQTVRELHAELGETMTKAQMLLRMIHERMG